MSDIQLTGGAVPMMISGKEFLASAFTDRDYSELSEYVKTQIILSTKRAADQLPAADRSELIQEAIKASMGVSWNSPEGASTFQTVEGLCRWAWQMTLKRHDMSFQDFSKLFMGDVEEIKANIIEVEEVYLRINGIEETQDTEITESEKK